MRRWGPSPADLQRRRLGLRCSGQAQPTEPPAVSPVAAVFPKPERVMSDDKSKRGSPDNRRIDIHDPNEVRHWTRSLGVTEEQLKDAVARVGTSADKVRGSLRK